MKYQIAFTSLLSLTSAGRLRRNGDIVGGEEVDIKSYPYQSLSLIDGSQWCGGTIVNKRHIVTAAHCHQGYDSSTFSVRLGSNNANSGGTVYPVTKISIHPDYAAKDNHDVAVLELGKDIVFGPGVQAISGLLTSTAPDGTDGVVSGWGDLHSGGPGTTKLHAVHVPIVNHAQCAADYKSESVIDDTMICAAVPEGGKDSCQGDSGGPYVIGGKLAGIVSFGHGCAVKGYPGVYTDVVNPSVRAFIKKYAGI